MALMAFTAATVWLTHGWWAAAIGRSLVCEPSLAAGEAIVIENFGTQYLLFERARDLRRAGLAHRVLIPTPVDLRTSRLNEVSKGFTEVMARISHLGNYELIPTREVEPISLNVARDVLRYLQRERIKSILVVSPLFRSNRSARIYSATLGQAGISVHCVPARQVYDLDTWVRTWHGIQEVAEQWLKLQYYRVAILPVSGR